MNTEIKNLEAKINELEMRFNNAKDNDNLKLDLINLISEFQELKTKILNEEKITIDSQTIEDLAETLGYYINDCSSKNFRSETYSQYDIDDAEFSISYDSEIELESAVIDIKDYFKEYFIFNYDQFKRFLNDSKYKETQIQVIELMPIELFTSISEIIYKSVDEIHTRITFDNFEDFDCELSDKRIEVTSVEISSYEFEKKFFDDFDYSSISFEDIIKSFYDFKEEEEEE
jgi:hypothetical protein